MRVLVVGATSVEYVLVNSPVKLEESFVTDTGISNIDLAKTLPAGTQVDLIGVFETVNVMSSNVKVNVPSGSVQALNVLSGANNNEIALSKEATVLKLVLDSVTALLGAGKVDQAVVNQGAAKSTFETKPVQLDGAGAATAQPSAAPPIVVAPVNPGPVTTPSPTASPAATPTPTASPVATPTPTATPIVNPTPIVTPQPTVNTCAGTTEECRSAVLEDFSFGEFTLEHVNWECELLGESGFRSDGFKYSVINNLEHSTVIPVSVTKSTYATMGIYVVQKQGLFKTSQYYFDDEDEFTLYVSPDQEVSLDITVISGDESNGKNYEIIFQKKRSIQESFKIRRIDNYNGEKEEWGHQFRLSAGIVNGERLLENDLIEVYESPNAGTPLRTGNNNSVLMQEEDFLNVTGSFYVKVIRNGEVFAEGDYQYDFTPIPLISGNAGVEVKPLTREQLISAFNVEFLIDTPLKAGSHSFLNIAKLRGVVPNAVYYTSTSEILEHPMYELPDGLSREQLKQGIFPHGFYGNRLDHINELVSGPVPVGGDGIRLDQSYITLNFDPNAPKEVYDQLFKYVFFDSNMNIIGYVLIPVAFDEEHVAEGYTPVNNWKVTL